MITLKLTTDECVVLERALGFRANADDRVLAMAIRERLDAERVKTARKREYFRGMCVLDLQRGQSSSSLPRHKVEIDLRDQDPRAVTMNGKRKAVRRPIRTVSQQTVGLDAVQLSCGHIVALPWAIDRDLIYGTGCSWLVCDACTVEYFGSEK